MAGFASRANSRAERKPVARGRRAASFLDEASDDSGLLFHSAIALDEASMKKLDAWGPPEVLLIPHIRHRMDAARFKRRYPALRIYAPPGVMAKARAVVSVDGAYADLAHDSTVSLELLAGTGEMEGALLVHSSDGTSVVLTEVVFDLEPPKSALGRAALKLAGFGPGPKVTPVVKFEMVKDKVALAAHFEQLAAIPDLVRLIVGHSRMSVGEAASRGLRLAAASL